MTVKLFFRAHEPIITFLGTMLVLGTYISKEAVSDELKHKAESREKALTKDGNGDAENRLISILLGAEEEVLDQLQNDEAARKEIKLRSIKYRLQTLRAKTMTAATFARDLENKGYEDKATEYMKTATYMDKLFDTVDTKTLTVSNGMTIEQIQNGIDNLSAATKKLETEMFETADSSVKFWSWWSRFALVASWILYVIGFLAGLLAKCYGNPKPGVDLSPTEGL